LSGDKDTDETASEKVFRVVMIEALEEPGEMKQ